MSFLTVPNIKFLLGILQEFFVEKYQMDLSNIADKINLRLIVFNEMKKIDQTNPNDTIKNKNKQAFKTSRDMILLAVSHFRQRQHFEDEARNSMMPSTFQTFLPPERPIMEEFEKINNERREVAPPTPAFTQDEPTTVDNLPTPEEFNSRVEEMIRERETMMNSVVVDHGVDQSKSTPLEELAPMDFDQAYHTMGDHTHTMGDQLIATSYKYVTIVHHGSLRDWFATMPTIMSKEFENPLMNVQRIEFVELFVPNFKRTQPVYVLKLHDFDLETHVTFVERVVVDNGRTFCKFVCDLQVDIPYMPSLRFSLHSCIGQQVALCCEPIEISSLKIVKSDIVEVSHDVKNDGAFVEGDIILFKLCCDDEELIPILDMLMHCEGYEVKKKKTKSKGCFYVNVPSIENDVDLSQVTGFVLNHSLQASFVAKAYIG